MTEEPADLHLSWSKEVLGGILNVCVGLLFGKLAPHEGFKSLNTQGYGTLPAATFYDIVHLPVRFQFEPVHWSFCHHNDCSAVFN